MNPIVGKALAKAGEAISEVAKKDADSFLKATLGEPLKAVGGLLTDQVNARRHANLVNVVVKAKQQLSQAGISPKEVPLSIIHPAIEAASLSEDPEMQEVWANLLANAADPRHENLVLPSFPSILKEMVSRDARFIDALYLRARQQRAQPYFSATGMTFDESNLLDVYAGAGLSREPQLTKLSAEYRKSHKETLDADFNAFDLTLGLALRQNVLTKEEVPIPLRLRGDDDYRSLPSVLEIEMDVVYSFTGFGCAFIAACQPVKGDLAVDTGPKT